MYGRFSARLRFEGWLFARWLLCTGLVFLALCMPTGADAGQASDGQRLTWWNHEITVLRATLAGVDPQTRVAQARLRLSEIPDLEMDAKLHYLSFSFEGQAGVQFMLGDRLLFSIVEGDLDPETRHHGVESQSNQIVARLEVARQAWRESRGTQVVLLGLVRVLMVVLLALSVLWVLAKLVRRIADALERHRNERAMRSMRMDWRELLDRLASRLSVILQWLFSSVVLYIGLEQVLASFPVTRPLALQIREWLANQLSWVLHGIWTGIPGLVTMVMIMMLARALADLLGYLFDAIQRGRVVVPFIHPETTTATRRIVIAFVWLVAVALSYPYLPGAGTQAFQGLSVLAGLLITIGASGIVNQAISGVVLIYARALRLGDFVEVAGIEGVVINIGNLAVKVRNHRNEEITIPNAVLLARPIFNYSRQADDQGTLVSTKVTIGYDAPWRRVHELLCDAASETGQFRRSPPPRVFQRSLSDFYVEYELLLGIDDPMNRIAALSDLHARIQDQFNRAGIQIMSPHFAFGPEKPVVVPESEWFGNPPKN